MEKGIPFLSKEMPLGHHPEMFVSSTRRPMIATTNITNTRNAFAVCLRPRNLQLTRLVKSSGSLTLACRRDDLLMFSPPLSNEIFSLGLRHKNVDIHYNTNFHKIQQLHREEAKKLIAIISFWAYNISVKF